MNSSSLIVLLSTCALVCLERQVSAREEGASAPGVAPPPALPALPKWSISGSAAGAFGFKDNLLLSSAGEERSAFARGVVETIVMRVPTGVWDQWMFAEAEGTHFFTGRTVENEAKIWVHHELGWRPGGKWKFNLPVTGYYHDHVLDLSDTEIERLAAEIKVTGLMAGPVVRWTFLPDWWIETQGIARRERYADGVNDARVAHAALRLSWKASERVELRASGERRWRDFDSRAQYSAAGRELTGTRLKVGEEEGELRFNLKWDRAGNWQTVIRCGLRRYGDNGSGYFDYRERKVEQEVEANLGAWFVRLGGAARRIDFEVQTVGIGINPPARLRDQYELNLHAERKLNPRWTLWGEFNWERSRSNEQVVSYVVNEGLLGVRWSWEK